MQGNDIHPDIVLLGRIRKNDEKSFEILFNKYYADLCIYAHGIVNDEEASKDIVVESFMKIWETRGRIKIKQSFKVYMFRLVHNRSLNHVRHQNVRTNYRNTIAREASLNDYDQKDHPLHHLELSELRGRIDMAIKSLPEKCRKIFEMNRFDDKTYKEIANHFDITISTVQTQVRRALERIAKCIEEEGETGN